MTRTGCAPWPGDLVGAFGFVETVGLVGVASFGGAGAGVGLDLAAAVDVEPAAEVGLTDGLRREGLAAVEASEEVVATGAAAFDPLHAPAAATTRTTVNTGVMLRRIRPNS